MLKLASAAQMKRMDDAAIHERNIPSTLLMERAAEGLLREVNALGDGPVAVFAGVGNNGGDGVAVAAMLKKQGRTVRCFLVGEREKMTPDCREMALRLAEAGGEAEPFDPENLEQTSYAMDASVIVDALFGVGLNAPLREPGASAVKLINLSGAKVISADVPSGVEADTGRVLGDAVRADVTVTFSMAKPGLFVGKGGVCAGRVVVHDIGIPADLMEQEPVSTFLVDGELVKSWLPARPVDGHKGTFGKVLIVGGAGGYCGAPVLASRGALRTGAGLVTLAVPSAVYETVAVKCDDEAMVRPLPNKKDGTLSEDAIDPLMGLMAGRDAALIGPGMGRSGALETLTCCAAATAQFPLVVDADGINALAGHMDVLEARRGRPTVLTPHDGEFARMGGDLSSGDRLGAARAFARRHGVILVLKGHNTIVAVPNGQCFVNANGNSGMAKGGSGDVLGGMILALLGQKLNPVRAAVCAVYLHGRAGDLAAADKGEYGMLPSDLVGQIPYAIKELTEQ